MSKQCNSADVLAIAVIFISAGWFVAFLTLTGTFEKSGFKLLWGFNTYLFGMAIALTLAVIDGVLLFRIARQLRYNANKKKNCKTLPL